MIKLLIVWENNQLHNKLSTLTNQAAAPFRVRPIKTHKYKYGSIISQRTCTPKCPQPQQAPKQRHPTLTTPRQNRRPRKLINLLLRRLSRPQTQPFDSHVDLSPVYRQRRRPPHFWKSQRSKHRIHCRRCSTRYGNKRLVNNMKKVHEGGAHDFPPHLRSHYEKQKYLQRIPAELKTNTLMSKESKDANAAIMAKIAWRLSRKNQNISLVCILIKFDKFPIPKL